MSSCSLPVTDLPEFDQMEAERLDLRRDAERRGLIFERPDQHGIAALRLGRHRGKGGQRGRSEPASDPDCVQARGRGHAPIVEPDMVSPRRRDQVIALPLGAWRSPVSSRYERASMIVTSNKPFSAWGEIFGDDMAATAMIDRLIHHAEILSLKGDSYRLRGKDLDARIGAKPAEIA